MCAFHRGPNIVTDGLVFGYDADERSSRFYKGEPTTNLLTLNISETSVDGSGQGVVGTRTILGLNHVRIVDVNSNTRQSNTISSGLIGGGIYTMSIWFKKLSGTPTFRFQIQGLTNGVQTSTIKFTNTAELGITDIDDWQLGKWTFTLGASENGVRIWYQDGADYTTYTHSFELKDPQLENKSHPTQFTLPNTTRSSNQSLIDLKRTTSIDLTNVSFDSTGHMVFDGTDDYITIPNSSVINISDNVTVEVVYKRITTDPIVDIIAQKYSNGWELYHRANGFFGFGGRNGDGNYYYCESLSAYSDNIYYHIVGMKTGLYWKMYINGELVNTTTANSIGDLSSSAPLVIGIGGVGYYPNMYLPVFKLYNRALSDSEIKLNYNSHRHITERLGNTWQNAASSAKEIKQLYPNSPDGVYWINLPTVGPTLTYCLMDDRYDGGGWMMMMKATRGTTFYYDSNYWTTNNTLNPTALNQNDGDAKFDVMNYYSSKDMMALFPDIPTYGGSIKGTTNWTWLENNFYGGNRIVPITLFNTVDRYFIRHAKTFSGWKEGIFSSQTDINFYGFNWTDNKKARWGFGWNENGGGLWPGGAQGSDDVGGGIGLGDTWGANYNYSAGDYIGCCQDTTGLNRSMRVEIYVR